MLAYIAYMDPMGISMVSRCWTYGLKQLTHSWASLKLILSTVECGLLQLFFDQEKLLNRETHGFLRQTKQLGAVVDLMFLLVSSQFMLPHFSAICGGMPSMGFIIQLWG